MRSQYLHLVFFSIFEYLSLGEVTRVVFGKAQYLGIVCFPLFWLIFTLRYAHCDGWLSRPVLALLSVIPIMSLLLALSDPWHGWIWRSATVTTAPFPQLVIDHGWWFSYVLMPQSYVLLIAGFGVLLSASFAGSHLYQRQTLVLLSAAIIPFFCNVLYIAADVTFYGLDLTPVGFAVSGLLVHLGLFHAKFLDIAPVSYKTVFTNTVDAVILLDIHQRIVDLNPSALVEGREAFEATSVIGQPFERVFPDYRVLLRGAQDAELTKTLKLPNLFTKRRDDRQQEVFREIKVRSLRSPSGRQVGSAIIIRDVTLEKRQQAQLEQFAYIDSLTGLFNRRQLEIKAEEAFAFYPPQIAATRSLIALLYVDLNHFKPINDAYGHEVGDHVLQHFARCLQSSVRQGDVVARLGGDEFAALLHGASPEVALEVRSRLAKNLNQEIIFSGHRMTISASIGIAYYPLDGKTLQDLLRRADQDMYREKRMARNA